MIEINFGSKIVENWSKVGQKWYTWEDFGRNSRLQFWSK
jgi:hypothetical protein